MLTIFSSILVIVRERFLKIVLFYLSLCVKSLVSFCLHLLQSTTTCIINVSNTQLHTIMSHTNDARKKLNLRLQIMFVLPP